ERAKRTLMPGGLQAATRGPLLAALRTSEEDGVHARRFDIPLLADRLEEMTKWLDARLGNELRIGYFGWSTGAAAALRAASREGSRIRAIVCRGGRPGAPGGGFAPGGAAAPVRAGGEGAPAGHR